MEMGTTDALLIVLNSTLVILWPLNLNTYSDRSWSPTTK